MRNLVSRPHFYFLSLTFISILSAHSSSITGEYKLIDNSCMTNFSINSLITIEVFSDKVTINSKRASMEYIIGENFSSGMNPPQGFDEYAEVGKFDEDGDFKYQEVFVSSSGRSKSMYNTQIYKTEKGLSWTTGRILRTKKCLLEKISTYTDI